MGLVRSNGGTERSDDVHNGLRPAGTPSRGHPGVTGLVASSGLSAAEVAQRQARGQTNAADRGPGRTLWAIVRANVLTRFNALIGGLLVLVLIFGPPQDGLFGLVIVVNSAVGIVVGSDELEVDESLLTGEAEPVSRGAGARVLSGSFVAAGAGELIATGVGRGAYANRLVAEASRFDLAHSELMAGINRILRLITWVIVPIGVLLLISQLRSNQSFAAAMVGSVAGIAPMVPEGLVLMTSVAFAVGAIRLARRRCLVQQLPAIEVLARADVLCLDKTGTLTEPGMDLVDIRVSGRPPAGADDAVVRQALAAVVGCDPVPNPTVRAIVAALPPPPGWSPARSAPRPTGWARAGCACSAWAASPTGSWRPIVHLGQSSRRPWSSSASGCGPMPRPPWPT